MPRSRQHVGRERAKRQALDYLVARQAAADGGAGGAPAAAAKVLSEPAGTGRTAFARALAAALGRPLRLRPAGPGQGAGADYRRRQTRCGRGAGAPSTPRATTASAIVTWACRWT